METVRQNIFQLRQEITPCAQATLLGISRGIDAEMPSEKIVRAAAAGLRGGIGKTFNEGTCGALTGAVIALGLLFYDDEAKATELSNELFNYFMDEFGTVMCGKITNEHGLKKCTECCVKAGCRVAEMYERETSYIINARTQ